jgi:SAM-dependent MidA family methyltransferase
MSMINHATQPLRKGLSEYQNNHLLAEALANGYVTALGVTLHRWISQHVAIVSAGRRVDLLEIGGGRGSLLSRPASRLS